MNESDFGQDLFSFVDEVKDLFSPELWNNILLDCTKNEMLILWLIYRNEKVNMSQIAEYIHVPLNTATGIVARMEKRELVLRERSAEDKRVVMVVYGDRGTTQMQMVIQELTYHFAALSKTFTTEEINLTTTMMQKIMSIMKQKRAMIQEEETPKKTVKKIEIL